MTPVLRQGWEKFSLYLPIILMGMLALGTWWLVRNAPAPVAAAAASANPHQPDYFMKLFSVKSFDATGRMQSEIKGEMGRHYPDTDTLEVDKVHMRSVTPQGLVTLATADRALSNADGSEVQLFGNAVVTREALPGGAGTAQPRLEFRGEFLHAFTQTERVRSDQPVVLIRGNDRFTADAMEYDHLDQVLQLRGRVRGILMPAASR
ncbi:MAG: LPS export ABC transporter periplasmic protein LptC [Acidovorax sp.]|jgi:lipopolysaccharide export system protein LptC|nr:LPS export ABC transporter periplasmic protein LptC [Acidovorax sp.]